MCAYNYTYRYNIKAVFTSGGATRHYTGRSHCYLYFFRLPSPD